MNIQTTGNETFLRKLKELGVGPGVYGTCILHQTPVENSEHSLTMQFEGSGELVLSDLRGKMESDAPMPARLLVDNSSPRGCESGTRDLIFNVSVLRNGVRASFIGEKTYQTEAVT